MLLNILYGNNVLFRVFINVWEMCENFEEPSLSLLENLVHSWYCAESYESFNCAISNII